MSNTDKYQPSEQEVVEASSLVLTELPSLGISKLLSRLQREKNWALSEKRLKTVLTASGLRSSPASVTQKKGTSAADVPHSALDSLLSVPNGVKAVYFDSIKGKGLVADRDFDQGDIIFSEDAFIAAPPAHALPAVERGELCTQCFAPLSTLLVVPCGKTGCQARFCNRLCQARSQSTHHALLCPGQNTSIKPFNRYLSIQKWLSLSVVARSTARILLTHSSLTPPSINQSGQNGTSPPVASLEETLGHFDAFATVSELERRKRNPGWDVEKDAFLSAMKEAHRLLCDGMDPRKERRGKWPIRNGFPEQVAESLFSWDNFVRMLGRSNLNTEAQGGMYLVHSHLNHSCAPNVSISHPPSRAGVRQATKVAALARRSIKAGEELFITYQEPNLSLARRRMLLWREYMFGPCRCDSCVQEESEMEDGQRKEMESGAWKKDEKEEEEIEKRRQHSDMIDKLERERNDKLRAEGKPVEERDLTGLEDELRTSLGF